METTVQVVWPKPVHTTKASMKALRVMDLEFHHAHALDEEKLAHVEMVRPNCHDRHGQLPPYGGVRRGAFLP